MGIFASATNTDSSDTEEEEVFTYESVSDEKKHLLFSSGEYPKVHRPWRQQPVPPNQEPSLLIQHSARTGANSVISDDDTHSLRMQLTKDHYGRCIRDVEHYDCDTPISSFLWKPELWKTHLQNKQLSPYSPDVTRHRYFKNFNGQLGFDSDFFQVVPLSQHSSVVLPGTQNNTSPNTDGNIPSSLISLEQHLWSDTSKGDIMDDKVAFYATRVTQPTFTSQYCCQDLLARGAQGESGNQSQGSSSDELSSSVLVRRPCQLQAKQLEEIQEESRWGKALAGGRESSQAESGMESRPWSSSSLIPGLLEESRINSRESLDLRSVVGSRSQSRESLDTKSGMEKRVYRQESLDSRLLLESRASSRESVDLRSVVGSRSQSRESLDTQSSIGNGPYSQKSLDSRIMVENRHNSGERLDARSVVECQPQSQESLDSRLLLLKGKQNSHQSLDLRSVVESRQDSREYLESTFLVDKRPNCWEDLNLRSGMANGQCSRDNLIPGSSRASTTTVYLSNENSHTVVSRGTQANLARKIMKRPLRSNKVGVVNDSGEPSEQAYPGRDFGHDSVSNTMVTLRKVVLELLPRSRKSRSLNSSLSTRSSLKPKDSANMNPSHVVSADIMKEEKDERTTETSNITVPSEECISLLSVRGASKLGDGREDNKGSQTDYNNNMCARIWGPKYGTSLHAVWEPECRYGTCAVDFLSEHGIDNRYCGFSDIDENFAANDRPRVWKKHWIATVGENLLDFGGNNSNNNDNEMTRQDEQRVDVMSSESMSSMDVVVGGMGMGGIFREYEDEFWDQCSAQEFTEEQESKGEEKYKDLKEAEFAWMKVITVGVQTDEIDGELLPLYMIKWSCECCPEVQDCSAFSEVTHLE